MTAHQLIDPAWMVVAEPAENFVPVILRSVWPVALCIIAGLIVAAFIREFFLKPLGEFKFASLIAESKATMTAGKGGEVERARPERIIAIDNPSLPTFVPFNESPRPAIDDDNVYRLAALEYALELEALRSPDNPRQVDIREIDARAAKIRQTLKADPLSLASRASEGMPQ